MTEKKSKKKEKTKSHIVTWNEITEQVYGQLYLYASRFLKFSIIVMVVGVIALTYAILSLFLFGAVLQDLFVFLGVFIGVGAISVSLILLLWGLFWRKRVDSRKIF